jgi:hypothetical protein
MTGNTPSVPVLDLHLFLDLPDRIREAQASEINALLTTQELERELKGMERDYGNAHDAWVADGWASGAIDAAWETETGKKPSNAEQRKQAQATWLASNPYLGGVDPVADTRAKLLKANANYDDWKGQRRYLENKMSVMRTLLELCREKIMPLKALLPDGEDFENLMSVVDVALSIAKGSDMQVQKAAKQDAVTGMDKAFDALPSASNEAKKTGKERKLDLGLAPGEIDSSLFFN